MVKKMEEHRTWLNTAQACDYLGMGKETLRLARDKKQLNSYTIEAAKHGGGYGNRVHYKRQDLDEWMETYNKVKV